jgi:hypothetical protein
MHYAMNTNGEWMFRSTFDLGSSWRVVIFSPRPYPLDRRLDVPRASLELQPFGLQSLHRLRCLGSHRKRSQEGKCTTMCCSRNDPRCICLPVLEAKVVFTHSTSSRLASGSRDIAVRIAPFLVLHIRVVRVRVPAGESFSSCVHVVQTDSRVHPNF